MNISKNTKLAAIETATSFAVSAGVVAGLNYVWEKAKEAYRMKHPHFPPNKKIPRPETVVARQITWIGSSYQGENGNRYMATSSGWKKINMQGGFDLRKQPDTVLCSSTFFFLNEQGELQQVKDVPHFIQTNGYWDFLE